MIVSSRPGVFIIVDRNTTRFFVGHSTKDMYERVRNHLWKIEEGCHEYLELNKAFAYRHEIEYASLIDFAICTHPSRIREKRNQVIYGLQTYQQDYGFNGELHRSNQVRHFNIGVYAIIVLDKKTKLRKFYIGQSNDIKKRLEKHRYDLHCKAHTNIALQEDYTRDDRYEFQFVSLLTFRDGEITQDKLNNLEVHFIFVLKSYFPDYGYNKNARGICIHRK